MADSTTRNLLLALAALGTVAETTGSANAQEMGTTWSLPLEAQQGDQGAGPTLDYSYQYPPNYQSWIRGLPPLSQFDSNQDYTDGFAFIRGILPLPSDRRSLDDRMPFIRGPSVNSQN